MHYGAYTRLSLLGITLLITTQISGCFSSSGITGAAFSKLPDPNISMDSLPPVLRGEYEYKVSFQVNVAERLTINSVVVELSQDGGSTYSPIANLSGNSSVFPWKTPKLDAGNLKLRMTAYDNRSNNTSTESRVFEIMSTPPSFGVNQPKQVLNKDRTFELDGKCDNRWPIHLSTVVSDGLGKIISGNTQVLNCSDGKWSVPGGLKTSTDGIMSYNLNQTDAAGNTSMSAGTWTSDTTAPSDVKLSVVTNPGDRTVQGTDQKVTSSINYIPLSISAADPLAGIRDFCLKYATTSNPSSPANDDSCWIRSNRGDLLFGPGSNPNQLSIAKYTQRIGFTPGNYSIYVWVRDNAGNINQASSSGSSVAVDYYPKLPPQFANLTATTLQNSNSAYDTSGKPIQQNFTTTQGPIYIRWQNIETDKHNPLESNPISLYYTTDDQTYIPIPNAQYLSKNYLGGGCQIDSSLHNGCFSWSGSLPSGYFKVRITARDINGQVSASSTNPINSWPLAIVAGNTDPGAGELRDASYASDWGTSGTSSMFFNNLSDARAADSGSLVVLNDGTIFFKDLNRGILTVNPRDGVQRVFLRLAKSGEVDSKRGDGGPVSQAWAKAPIKIALDWSSEGGLLIMDSDRIRRIDLKTLTINSLIGSATPPAAEPDDSSDPIDPQQVKFTAINKLTAESVSQFPLIALPNGDIYFQSENYMGTMARLRVYSQGKVSSIYPTGNSPEKIPTVNGTNITWNNFDYSGPLDQAFTGEPIGSQFYRIYNYRLAFDYDTQGDSKVTTLQAAFIHNHAGGRHGLFGELKLDPNNKSKAIVSPNGLQAMMFEPLNYSHTGRDGKLYVFNRQSARIYRYNLPASGSEVGTWTLIAGNGVQGSCEDQNSSGVPTKAIACPIDVQDVFVTANSEIYFVDRGRIRTISDEGNIITLYGQGYSYGDTKLASSARFGMIRSIGQVFKNGKTEIVAIDPQESRIRTFEIGGTIQNLIGNGLNAASNTNLLVSNPAHSIQTTNSSDMSDSLAVDSNSGDLYLFQRAENRNKISRINRSNNPDRWENIVGQGSTPYDQGDGKIGSQITFSSGSNSQNRDPQVIGYQNGQLLVAHSVFSNSLSKNILGYFKIYDLTQNGLQINLAGHPTIMGSFCAAGTPLSASSGCSIPSTNSTTLALASYIPATNTGPASWLVLHRGTKDIRRLSVGGNMEVFMTSTRNLASFAYREKTLQDGTSQKIVYYCGFNDGRLYSKVIGSSSSAETQLSWNVSNIQCSGRSLLYNSGRNSLIFPVQQNGMAAIAEYFLDN